LADLGQGETEKCRAGQTVGGSRVVVIIGNALGHIVVVHLSLFQIVALHFFAHKAAKSTKALAGFPSLRSSRLFSNRPCLIRKSVKVLP
jgi:hypothetical protein